MRFLWQLYCHGNLFITSKELEAKFHQVQALEPQIKRPSQDKWWHACPTRYKYALLWTISGFEYKSRVLDETFHQDMPVHHRPKEAWEDHCVQLICDKNCTCYLNVVWRFFCFNYFRLKMVSKGALSLIILVEANWCWPFSCSLMVGCTAQLHNFLAPTSW